MQRVAVGRPCIIDFNIPGPGPHTIQPTIAQPLDALTDDKITIDGTTQPGYNGTPLIVINGASAGSTSGLVMESNNSTIKGLVINGFAKIGIEIIDSNNNVVEGCYIGTDDSGTQSVANEVGIFVDGDSINNVIGGTTTAAGNLISGTAWKA